MLLYIVLVLVGLVVLLKAGDYLVQGAVGLAMQLSVPPLLVGLTVVAFGTSAPELVVSLGAVLSGEGGIAVGNIIGSNIANILMVLGFPAILSGIALTTPKLRRHAITMFVASLAFAYVVYGVGVLSFPAGALFLLGIVLYIGYIAIDARRTESPPELMEEVEELATAGGSGSKTMFFIIAGLIGLPLGGWLMVEYGAKIAEELNVREEIIGLTIVAFGTSLPELATVWAAAVKRQAEIAVGNVIGSNIFNILFVGGAAGLAGTTGFSEAAKTVDVPVMLLTAFALTMLIIAKSRITRVLGAIFGACYIAYIIGTSMMTGGL